MLRVLFWDQPRPAPIRSAVTTPSRRINILDFYAGSPLSPCLERSARSDYDESPPYGGSFRLGFIAAVHTGSC